MNESKHDILQFVEENDIKFVKLTFCNVLGHLKNISILSDELERAIDEGIAFDASSVLGFDSDIHSDLFLVPDLSTMSILPWRPSTGRVIRFFCNVINADGTPFSSDGRYILSEAVRRAADLGLRVELGTELEFYLFRTDENGDPTVPFDNGSYCDVAPFDKGENVRREICLTLEQMGITPEASHHEEGPGQNEIDFKYADALEAADNAMTFKLVVRSVAARNGLYASFSPKPIQDKSGNGFHVNISLRSGGNQVPLKLRDSFMAGIMHRIREITAFLNPTVQSYERLGEHKAPKYVSWSPENRSQLIRIPAVRGAERSRLELRSPDSSANPYLAFALLINAGLEGIINGTEPPQPVDCDLTKADEVVLSKLPKLPASLEEAFALAAESTFVREILGERIIKRCYEIALGK